MKRHRTRQLPIDDLMTSSESIWLARDDVITLNLLTLHDIRDLPKINEDLEEFLPDFDGVLCFKSED